MAPAVVSDSNVSLPPDLIQDLPLFLAPLEVRIGGGVYADGIDITADRFYEILETGVAPPTTSAPPPAAFLDAFEKAAARSGEVVCITLSANLSATHDAAAEAIELAKTHLPGLDVTLIDSRSAGIAQGLIALDAARLALADASTPEVVRRIHERIADTTLLGYLRSLHYLWRGGRIPRVALWMSRLFGLKPLLQLADGRIGLIERPRTDGRAMDRLVALAAERLAGRRARIAVMHAAEPAKAHALVERLRAELDPEEIFVTEFTPVIGAHTGPGLVGCAFHPADAV